MPPRKSTASNPPEDGAEPAPAPAKASKDKDGLGVDVREYSCSCGMNSHTNNRAGPHSAKIDDRPSRKRSPTSKHTDSEGRTTGDA
jgi:hypothetical protein